MGSADVRLQGAVIAMSMHPDEIAGRDFVIATEGYDRDEVRAFLEVVGRDQQALRDEIAQLREEVVGEGEIGKEIALALEAAKIAAEEATRRATREADELRKRTISESEELRRATVDASGKVREEADLYALETRAEADRETRRLLQETNDRIERLLDGASQVRDRLLGLDSMLEGVRLDVGEAASALEGAGSDAGDRAIVNLREAAGS